MLIPNMISWTELGSILSAISKSKLFSEDIENLVYDILVLIETRVEITEQESDKLLAVIDAGFDSIFGCLDYRNYN